MQFSFTVFCFFFIFSFHTVHWNFLLVNRFSWLDQGGYLGDLGMYILWWSAKDVIKAQIIVFYTYMLLSEEKLIHFKKKLLNWYLFFIYSVFVFFSFWNSQGSNILLFIIHFSICMLTTGWQHLPLWEKSRSQTFFFVCWWLPRTTRWGFHTCSVWNTNIC